MAADQRSKRLSSTSIVDGSSHEQHRAKRRTLESLQTGLNFNPHVTLELDGSQKKVVAKREQIGISNRDLAPYSSCVLDRHNILADVITLPKDIYSVETLEDVFSYEVWRNYLTKNERNLLSQFLPRGIDVEEVVELLFSGSNFFFGNPARNWTTLLAANNLHPDAIICREQNLVASRRAYCTELQDYHTSMVRNLLQLKEIWEGCQDPSRFLQSISRAKGVIGNTTSAPGDDNRLDQSDQNLGGTSESISAMEDEKACSSDDQVVVGTRSRELHTREGIVRGNKRSPATDIGDNKKDASRCKKVKKITKCIGVTDGAKYMSYIKVTKKQLKLLKRPAKGNQSKSYKHVLGNMDNCDIQPYSVFEEEEQKKLHDHWLLVVKTVSQAFKDWTMRQAQKKKIAQIVGEDIQGKRKQQLQNHANLDCTQEENSCAGFDSAMKVDDEDCVAPLADVQDTSPHELVGGVFEGNNMYEVDSEDHGINMDQVSSRHEDTIMVAMPPQNNACSNEMVSSYQHSMPDFSGSSGSAHHTIGGTDLSSVRGTWQTATLPLPSRQSTLANGYKTAAIDLFRGHLQSNSVHHPQFADSHLHGNPTEPGMLHRPTLERTFSAYQNDEDRSQLLVQSIYNNQELLSYKPEQKHSISQFQQAPNAAIGNSRLPLQYQEPLQHPLLFQPRQKRDEEFYLHQNLQNNIHDIDTGRGNSGFTVTGQEHSQPLNLQDWHPSSVNMTAPLQSFSRNGELINPGWFPVGQQVNGGWSNTSNDACNPDEGIRNRPYNNDESLFSVLSQCNGLQSGVSYDHSVSETPIITPGGFGLLGGGFPRNNTLMPQSALPIEYMGVRETPPPSPLLSNGVGWVSVPRQNSGLLDSTGKPFLRSWNQ